MDASNLPSFDDLIGLFPLPNVVLLPGATLPLHVFEPRYRKLVRDALAEDGLMAMALLQPGFEAYYYTNLAEIHPVVCVGRIRESAETADGRYLVNLVGLCRARVREEDVTGEYRRALLEPMVAPHSGIDVDGEYGARELCRRMLGSSCFDVVDEIDALRTFAFAERPLEDIVDRMAAELLPSAAVEIKQFLLAEPNVLQRVRILLTELGTVRRAMQSQQHNQDQWPRIESSN